MPPEAPIEISLESALALHRNTQALFTHRIALFKRRAVRYISRRCERAKTRGYHAGLEEGKAEFADLSRGIAVCYQQASEVAAQEGQKLALLLADNIVESHISEIPKSLLAWFNRAAALLRANSTLILLIHPRLHKTVQQVTHLLPSGLRIEINSALGAPDFTLTGDSGAVEFSWREALEALTLNSEAARQ
jgi:hypothetical protein